MISVEEALKLVDQHTQEGAVVSKKLINAYGLILAEDVISPINMPPFRQSSMDGYAIIHSGNPVYSVIGEMQAGASDNMDLKSGEAIRIFTGARVPDKADTIVIQEQVTLAHSKITIDKIPTKFANIRLQGEQVQKGDLVLEKGTFLNEAAIGFLAGLGFNKIHVYKIPKVSILVTGNELQKPGKDLSEGQVYDSNSVTLKFALQRFGIRKVRIQRVEDNLKATIKAIEKHLKKSDVLLISGGISVGDYDFVKQALLENNVQELFYNVNQKPGKPLWFGEKGAVKVFALPGNPASSLTCFYVYVVPAIRKHLGYKHNHLLRKKAIAADNITNPSGKHLFLKGNVINGKAELLSGQASSMLKSFAICNALLMVPSDILEIKKDEEIEYIPLINN